MTFLSALEDAQMEERLCRLFLLVSVILWPFGPNIAADGAEHRAAVWTTEDIQGRLLEIDREIEAWYLEYESEPSKKPGRRRGVYIHKTVALRFPSDCYHWAGKGDSRRDWHCDPLQQRSVTTAKASKWEFPFDRAFRLRDYSQDAPLPGSIKDELLYSVLGWWPLASRPTPKYGGQYPVVFSDLARSSDYQVRPYLELCEGVWCHVLEIPKRNALWLDMNRSGAMMAREWYHEATGIAVSLIEMRKHKEVKPGIWCPMEFRNVHFDYNAPTEEGRKRRVIDATLRVLDVKINEDVPDELFEFRDPLPGSLQFFEDGTDKQAVPGGYDCMDEMAGWIERNVYYAEPVAGMSTKEIVLHLVIIVLCMCIVVHCWRVRRARVTPVPRH